MTAHRRRGRETATASPMARRRLRLPDRRRRGRRRGRSQQFRPSTNASTTSTWRRPALRRGRPRPLCRRPHRRRGEPQRCSTARPATPTPASSSTMTTAPRHDADFEDGDESGWRPRRRAASSRRSARTASPRPNIATRTTKQGFDRHQVRRRPRLPLLTATGRRIRRSRMRKRAGAATLRPFFLAQSTGGRCTGPL